MATGVEVLFVWRDNTILGRPRVKEGTGPLFGIVEPQLGSGAGGEGKRLRGGRRGVRGGLLTKEIETRGSACVFIVRGDVCERVVNGVSILWIAWRYCRVQCTGDDSQLSHR